jgi:transcriptional regulator with XRE-family HTH domain
MLIDKITPIDIHVSAKLRQFRLAAGISQERLGDLIGVTFQQIQKYEKAQNRLAACRLFEISQILKRPISDFFSGLKADRMYYNYDFESNVKQVREAAEINKELLPLIRAFNAIESVQAKKHLIALANLLAKPKRKKIKHQYS